MADPDDDLENVKYDYDMLVTRYMEYQRCNEDNKQVRS